MIIRFANRREAGLKLAERLRHQRENPGLMVLALPPGGVPVAEEIARELHAPLDVLVVRNLGAPGDEAVAVGAIGPGGWCVVNRALVDDYGLSDRTLRRLAEREQRALGRCERTYRPGRGPLAVRGHVVMLVDDGIATGATMRAALAAARAGGARRVIAAAPVVAREAYLELRGKCDELVTLQIPKELGAVGEFYEDFRAVEDAEVCEALAHAVQA